MFWKKKKNKKQPPQKRVANTTKYFLKTVILGDGGVGKTNIRRRYIGQNFMADHLMTIGADFAAYETKIEFEGKSYNITFQIWDLAGQESFKSVRSMYYKGAFGGVLVFDRTRPISFENIPNWLKELKKNSGKGLVPFIILGNKFDLIDSASEIVPREQIDKYVEELNAEIDDFDVKFFDTSALTGLNIKEAFNVLGQEILKWINNKS